VTSEIQFGCVNMLMTRGFFFSILRSSNLVIFYKKIILKIIFPKNSNSFVTTCENLPNKKHCQDTLYMAGTQCPPSGPVKGNVCFLYCPTIMISPNDDKF
jgi:hypothetical protein